jgi:hypothetical protein
MSNHVLVPTKRVNGSLWGDLTVFGHHHLICGEKVDLKDDGLSFAGGHRVRLYSFKKNVHWKIPEGTSIDISDVTPASAPRRLPR